MLPIIKFDLFNQIIYLKAYDVFILLSILTGLIFSFSVLKKYGLVSKAILSIYFFIAISFIVGARLLNFILQYPKYKQAEISLFTLEFGYFSLYGGIILSFIVLLVLLNLKKLDILDILDKLTLPFLFSFIVGARLLNFILQYPKYKQAEISLFTLEFGYFSLYGGIILSFIVLLVLLNLKKLDILDILDKLTLPFLFSFFIMKIGCYLNGCCYGKPTKSWFAVPLPINQQATLTNNPLVSSIFGKLDIRVYPTQFMEGFGAVLIIIIILIIRKKLIKGQIFIVSAGLFSLLRLVVLSYRQLPYSDFVLKYFYPGLYSLIIITAVIGFVIIHRFNSKAPSL